MSRTTILKISVSVICLIALVLLYVFGGRVIEDDNMVFEAGQADDTTDAFVFDPETLIYDGTGDIDFLEGVTLEGYNEEQLKSMVYIRISTGDSLSEKIVEYTADTDDGFFALEGLKSFESSFSMIQVAWISKSLHNIYLSCM